MKIAKIWLLVLLLMPFLLQAQPQQSQKNQTQPASSLKSRESGAGTVRGVSFEYFKATVSDFSDSIKMSLADTAWQLWKNERWEQLERLFHVNSLNGCWPPDSGAVSLKIVTLDTGLLVDRYGGKYIGGVFQDWGKFVGVKGESFAARALPQYYTRLPYRLYKIIKPITGVKQGKVIPWYGEASLGIQFQLPGTINDLKKGGYIVEVTSTAPANLK